MSIFCSLHRTSRQYNCIADSGERAILATHGAELGAAASYSPQTAIAAILCTALNQFLYLGLTDTSSG
ncbi:MAG: YshB family small membrane protein [Symbiopectobacterium sp.]